MNKIDFSRPGRMLSGSKSGYDSAHPGHVVIFNANICVKSKGKVWYGDIDLSTSDMDEVRRLAAELGETVFVLREQDARFQTEANPNYAAAVSFVSPGGEVNTGRLDLYEIKDGLLRRKSRAA